VSDLDVRAFLDSHDLHDSVLDSVLAGEGEVVLSITLCAWRQAGYREGEPELAPIEVRFSGVTRAAGALDARDFTILECRLVDGGMRMFVLDDRPGGDVVEIVICADSVFVSYL